MNPKPQTESTNASEQPFFARFLEGQDYIEVQSDVKAGVWPPYDVTMKYPSDGDEWPTS